MISNFPYENYNKDRWAWKKVSPHIYKFIISATGPWHISGINNNDEIVLFQAIGGPRINIGDTIDNKPIIKIRYGKEKDSNDEYYFVETT